MSASNPVSGQQTPPFFIQRYSFVSQVSASCILQFMVTHVFCIYCEIEGCSTHYQQYLTCVIPWKEQEIPTKFRLENLIIPGAFSSLIMYTDMTQPLFL